MNRSATWQHFANISVTFLVSVDLNYVLGLHAVHHGDVVIKSLTKSIMKSFRKSHHYAIDAAEALDLCRESLSFTLTVATEDHDVFVELEATLTATERILHTHLVNLIETERQGVLESYISDILDAENEDDFDSVPSSLSESIRVLETLTKRQEDKRSTSQNGIEIMHRDRGDAQRHTFPQRSSLTSIPRSEGTEKSFSLNRESTPTGRPEQGSNQPLPSPSLVGRSVTDSLLFRLVVALQLCQVRIDDAQFAITGRRREVSGSTRSSSWTNLACVCLIAGTIGNFYSRRGMNIRELLKLSTRAAAGVTLCAIARYQFRQAWMSAKVAKSIDELKEWRNQWNHVHEDDTRGEISIEDKSQRLIDYALKQSPKSSFWHSEGELRFLIVKRCMDLLYASVGTAVEVTNDKRDWQIPLVAMAATYYSFVGPNRKAHEAVSSAAAQDIIQSAWGMISLPAIKLLSLKASRLLKRAALAERIVVNGVPCFILSKDPCPDIIASLKRHERQERRRSSNSRLTTINEKIGKRSSRYERGSLALNKRSVLLHLTGGGFFSHMIATDLPYLLDWSAKTGAIVICPEYALLPEFPFPTALNQVVDVYSSLLSGSCTSLLGFEVGRIIVTGESAGGNLAAALCVTLCSAKMQHVEPRKTEIEVKYPALETGCQLSELRLPAALMLSCPALNMSLDISHSRVVGVDDPVLPAGLISTISQAYLPSGVNKKDPLASPLFAPDNALEIFPPTLLIASSDDPLLDDSIHFNKRLRCLGVISELKATHHVPHAFWGLGTAGFPEAVQVQKVCVTFLVKHFNEGDLVIF